MLLENGQGEATRCADNGLQQNDLRQDSDDDVGSEHDEEHEFYKSKTIRVAHINLYLELPGEPQPELIQAFPAIFIDISQAKFTPTDLDPEKQASFIFQNNVKDQVGNPLGYEYRLRLADVIKHLKRQGYSLENVYVSYYSQIFSAFVNCNLDPIPNTIWLSEDDLQDMNGVKSLRLKFTRGIQRQFKDEDQESNTETLSANAVNEETGRRSGRTREQHVNNIEQKQKTKERTVGYVIEKVQQWRRLYNGFYDENHTHKRMSLEEAAD